MELNATHGLLVYADVSLTGETWIRNKRC